SEIALYVLERRIAQMPSVGADRLARNDATVSQREAALDGRAHAHVGLDARDHQTFDALLAEQQIQVGREECAGTPLRHQKLAVVPGSEVLEKPGIEFARDAVLG